MKNKEVCRNCWDVDKIVTVPIFENWWRDCTDDRLCTGCQYELEHTVMEQKEKDNSETEV